MLKVNMKTGETEQCSLLDLMEGGVKELAPVKPQETTLDIGYDSNRIVAVERPKMTPGQMRLDETGNVTSIKARA